MARYITDLTELSSSTFASGDFIEVWHAAGGSNRSKKLRLDRFAMLDNSNTFAATQIAPVFQVTVGDNGNGNAGGMLIAQRNTNVTNSAPGDLVLQRADGSGNLHTYYDNSNIMRVLLNTIPTTSNLATGTVIGSQTSSLDSKDVLDGEETPIEEVLVAIAQGAAAVRPFLYKPAAGFDDDGNYVEGARPFGGEQFEGVVVDYAPRYGMDRDEAHPAGKSLNEITVIGDLLRAVDWLIQKVPTDN